MLAAAPDDHVLPLLRFSPESGGLDIARKLSWAWPLHRTAFGHDQCSPRLWHHGPIGLWSRVAICRNKTNYKTYLAVNKTEGEAFS